MFFCLIDGYSVNCNSYKAGDDPVVTNLVASTVLQINRLFCSFMVINKTKIEAFVYSNGSL